MCKPVGRTRWNKQCECNATFRAAFARIAKFRINCYKCSTDGSKQCGKRCFLSFRTRQSNRDLEIFSNLDIDEITIFETFISGIGLKTREKMRNRSALRSSNSSETYRRIMRKHAAARGQNRRRRCDNVRGCARARDAILIGAICITAFSTRVTHPTGLGVHINANGPSARPGSRRYHGYTLCRRAAFMS